jgi:hypothetical protein
LEQLKVPLKAQPWVSQSVMPWAMPWEQLKELPWEP